MAVKRCRKDASSPAPTDNSSASNMSSPISKRIDKSDDAPDPLTFVPLPGSHLDLFVRERGHHFQRSSRRNSGEENLRRRDFLWPIARCRSVRIVSWTTESRLERKRRANERSAERTAASKRSVRLSIVFCSTMSSSRKGH